MKHIGIVECISSAQLYITDIKARGCRPLIIYPNRFDDEHLRSYREIIKKNIGDVADYIEEGDDYESFLDRLREMEVIAVVPGSDLGVALADRICKDLDLLGNDPATTRLRTTKNGMAEALGKAGLRKIEGIEVTCEDDIRKFVGDRGAKRFVLKFASGSGTVGLKICDSVEAGIEHYREMLIINDSIAMSKESPILIQEFIGGTEYIVNTASFNGRHLLTDVWMYRKYELEDGSLIYDTCELIKDLLPGHAELIEYAFKVLDAVGVRYGVCHSEFKVDEKGPVLIETNPRPMGAAQTAPFLDEALGHHMTNIGLASVLEPELFEKLKYVPYSPKKYAMMKFIAVPEDMDGDFRPAVMMAERLDSYREMLFFGEPGVHHYPKTKDLDTSPLFVKLINEDYGRLMRDYNIIRGIEKDYFRLFLYSDPVLKGAERVTDMKAVTDFMDPVRKICIVDDDGAMMYRFGTARPANTDEIFDAVVFAKCGPGLLSERYMSILSLMHQVRRGGGFVFLPETFANLPYGRAAAEAMLELMGFRILVSSSEATGIVRGERL